VKQLFYTRSTTHPSTVPKSLLTPLNTTHHIIHLGINSTENHNFHPYICPNIPFHYEHQFFLSVPTEHTEQQPQCTVAAPSRAPLLLPPSPPRSLVRDGQISPHRPWLVDSHSTCPLLSPSPHANNFVIRTAVVKTHTLSRTQPPEA